MTASQLRFGVDLVTFYHPGFWGVADDARIAALAAADGRAFWDTLLNAVAQAGVTGVEMTFPPCDWTSAMAAYGSADGVAAALAGRGLQLCSGFNIDLANYKQGDDIGALVDRARAYAAFIAACGGDVMVAGLPMRATPGLPTTAAYDFAAASHLADVVHQMAKAVAAQGVRLALHTEAHSVFAASRDIDLMLLLTDPALVHFCPDTAHMILMGGDPLAITSRHYERVIIAHWKDAIGRMPADTPIDADIHNAHRPYFCGFGQGRVDWQGWMRLLTQRGIGGWAILELDAAADPVSDLQRGLTFVRQGLLPQSH